MTVKPIFLWRLVELDFHDKQTNKQTIKSCKACLQEWLNFVILSPSTRHLAHVRDWTNENTSAVRMVLFVACFYGTLRRAGIVCPQTDYQSYEVRTIPQATQAIAVQARSSTVRYAHKMFFSHRSPFFQRSKSKKSFGYITLLLSLECSRIWHTRPSS